MTKIAILLFLALQSVEVAGLVAASKTHALRQHVSKGDRTSSAKDSVVAVSNRESDHGFFSQTPATSVESEVFRFGVYAVFVLLSALLYQKYVLREYYPVAGEPTDLPGATKCGFQHSCIDYGNVERDWKLCACACLCPLIVWAGTASRSAKPFMDFWPAVGMMLLLVILYPSTHGWSGLIILGLFVARRRQLRDVYDHSRDKVRTWAEDLCLVLCCNSFLCCQLMQEAREVEYERISDFKYEQEYKPPTAVVVESAPAQVRTLPPIQIPLNSHRVVTAGPLPQIVMEQAPSAGPAFVTGPISQRPVTTSVVRNGSPTSTLRVVNSGVVM